MEGNLMRRIVSSIVALSLVAGCVAPINQQRLFALQQQCAAGDPASCEAAYYQVQMNQQEAAQNAAATAAGLAILGVAIGAGVAAGQNNGHHHRHW